MPHTRPPQTLIRRPIAGSGVAPRAWPRVAWVLISLLGTAQAEDVACRVPVFRGAASPQGGEAQMQVVNNGQACGIRNFGQYPDANTLAHEGRITVPPQNGSAKFVAPRAVYTPAAGFVGTDHFEYQANAMGPRNVPILLKVRVTVTVTRE